MRIDHTYQKAVDLEIDKLCRLSPCELMALKPLSKTVTIDGIDIPISYHIMDLGEKRNIGVLSERSLMVGVRKFSSGIEVELKAVRMSDHDAANLYD